jgi:hypothetical protein
VIPHIRLLLLLAFLPAIAHAASDPIAIEVETVQAGPGSLASLSLRLRQPEGAPPIRQLREVICFPGDLLQLDGVYRGGAAAEAEAEMTHEAAPGDGCTRLIIQFTFARPPASGTLASIEFLVSDKAAVGTRAELTSQPEVTGATGPIEAVGIPGAVEIGEALKVFACFFYMH